MKKEGTKSRPNETMIEEDLDLINYLLPIMETWGMEILTNAIIHKKPTINYHKLAKFIIWKQDMEHKGINYTL